MSGNRFITSSIQPLPCSVQTICRNHDANQQGDSNKKSDKAVITGAGKDVTTDRELDAASSLQWLAYKASVTNPKVSSSPVGSPISSSQSSSMPRGNNKQSDGASASKHKQKSPESRTGNDEARKNHSQTKKSTGKDGNTNGVLKRILFLVSRSRTAKDNDSPRTQTSEQALNERLRVLLKLMIHRRLQKRELEISRAIRLHRMIGKRRYNEIQAIVQEVNQLRLTVSSLGLYHCHTGRETVPSSESGCNTTKAIFKGNMPDPVKRLFFHTRLIPALQYANADKAAGYDWDGLLLQAQQNLKDYKQWISDYRKGGGSPKVA